MRGEEGMDWFWRPRVRRSSRKRRLGAFRSRFHDRAQFLHAGAHHRERVARPQVFAEKLQRQPAAVADLAEFREITAQIEVAVAGPDAIGVVLLLARRLR